MQFSIHRLWLLVRKQWAENKQLYILGLLAVAGIIAACIIFSLTEFMGLDERVQENTLFFGLMASGFVFSTIVLNQLNQRLSSVSVLMLPASALEKFAMAAIYCMILFPACYLAVIYPLIALGHYVDHNIIGRPNSLYLIKANEQTLNIFLTFLLLQSAALFSTILFKRYALVKGIILVMIVFFGSLILNSILAKSIIKMDPGMPISSTVNETYYDAKNNIVERKVVKESLWAKVRSDQPFSDVEMSNWVVDKKLKGVDYVAYSTSITNPYSYVFVLLLVMSIPFLWVITWFRLKEKEL